MCYDDVSGDLLPPELVRAARDLEVEYLKRMNVYEVVPRSQVRESGKGKLIKGRRLDINKGDSAKPNIRSRYVGKEVATGVDATLYACTPPLEALKLIMGIASGDRHNGLHIMLNDVKRAYVHAEAQR